MDIRIRIGSPAVILQAEYQADAELFLREILAEKYDATLEVIENIPGRRGVTWVEGLSIFVGSSVGGALVSSVTNDLYDLAKRWARRRLRRKQAESDTGKARPVGFVIYGPNGEELRRWDTQKDEKDESTSS